MYLLIKRALDLIFGLFLFFLLGPLLVFIAILILLVDGRPILFLQVRPGLRETPFLLVKFRTMTSTFLGLDDDESPRLTRLGGLLRKTSLDELPSLWNIVVGDLSFVGPRPLLMEYLALFSSSHRRRHDVRPGLTGLAQISGRNLLSWQKRLDLDVAYVEKQSFWLDLRILICSIGVVLSSRGINQANGATMTRLEKGYEK